MEDEVMRLRSRCSRLAVRARFALAVMAAMVIALPRPSFASGDAAHGESVYRTCLACHSVAKNGVGPKHDGVFGAKAGSVAGYDYSPALKSSGLVWDEMTLDGWLAN